MTHFASFIINFLTIIVTDSGNIMREFAAGGKKGKGQVIDLLALAISDYRYNSTNPSLKFLPKTLAQMMVFEYSRYINPEVSRMRLPF